MFSWKSVWSSVSVISLLSFTFSPMVGTLSVNAAPSAENLYSFQLDEGMTIVGMAQSGAGVFANGNPGAYAEKSCVPILLEFTNGSKATKNVSTDVAFDFDAAGEGIDDLESISSLLTDNPLTATDDLSDFSYSGTALSTTVSAWTASGNLAAVITGPFGDDTGTDAIDSSDSSRHYHVEVANLPAGDAAYIPLCARLGVDAGQAPGASVSVHLGNGGGENVPVNASDLVELPSLTISKAVSGGTAVPSDFSFEVTPGLDGVSASTVVNIPENEESVTLTNLSVNSSQVFSIQETGGPASYAFASGLGTNCVFSGAVASATVVAAAEPVNATCSFTNTLVTKPQLTIVKHVVNDHGGSLSAEDFVLHVSGTNVSLDTLSGADLGVTITLDPGSYEVTEDAVAGYTGTFSADCTGTIASGESKICTVTNDDEQAALTVITVVDNTAGGTFIPGDFLVTVNDESPLLGSSEGTVFTVNAGEYSVIASPAVNYVSSYSEGCSGTLTVGEERACTVTMTYVAPSPTQGTLIVRKHVTNDSGFGTADAADFTLNVHDTNGIVTPVTGSEAGVTVLIDPGQYAVSEAANSSYSALFDAGCSGSISAGETRTCTVTNDDYPAVLPTKDILPSVLCVSPTDHNTYTAYFGFNNMNEENVFLPIGTDNSVTGGGLQGNSYGQPEVFAAGASPQYPGAAFSVEFDGSPITWLLRVAGDSTLATAYGESTERCPMVIPSTLTVVTDRITDNGGPTLAVENTMSTVHSDGPDQTFVNSPEGHLVTLVPGAYSVTASEIPGYTVSFDAGCTGTIMQGETLRCMVMYNDISPSSGSTGGGGSGGGGTSPSSTGVIIITNVINDHGGESVASAFRIHVKGENPSPRTDFQITAVGELEFAGSTSGMSVALDPGAYSINVTQPGGYLIQMSAGCSGSLSLGQVNTCVITPNDEEPVSILPAPAPVVLGINDEAPSETVDLPVLALAPAPQVLGVTDEELPRTGLPVGFLLVLAGGAAYVLQRKS